MAKLYKAGRFIGWTWIGSNSASVVDGDLLSIGATGAIEKAGVGTKIVGVAAGAQSVAADNETVAKAKITYISADEYTEVEIKADDVVSQANVGQSFDLNADQTVDVATAWSGTQVKMVEFVNQDNSKYSIIK